MTVNAASLERFSAAVAETLESALAPLQKEIASLRRTLQQMQTPAPATPAPRSPGRARAVATPQAADKPAVSTACRVPDCPAPVLAKDLCETHYRIMRRSLAANEDFDLEAQRPARLRKAARACNEDGCEEAHYAKGLCRRHYMAERSRIRNARRAGAPAARVARTTKTPAATSPAPVSTEEREHDSDSSDHDAAPTAHLEDPAEILKQESLRRELGGVRNPFEQPESVSSAPDGSLPTAEMVSRVVAQYRGGLDRVAEVLGRNKRTLLDLLDHLDLMPYVARVRGAERQRVEDSSLQDRLNDLLFREKLLEDLGCLKEIDERTGFEVKMRCNELTRKHDSIEDVLQTLGRELRLEDAGMKRLIWRYDLRRYLRGQGLKSNAHARVRA